MLPINIPKTDRLELQKEEPGTSVTISPAPSPPGSPRETLLPKPLQRENAGTTPIAEFVTKSQVEAPVKKIVEKRDVVSCLQKILNETPPVESFQDAVGRACKMLGCDKKQMVEVAHIIVSETAKDGLLPNKELHEQGRDIVEILPILKKLLEQTPPPTSFQQVLDMTCSYFDIKDNEVVLKKANIISSLTAQAGLLPNKEIRKESKEALKRGNVGIVNTEIFFTNDKNDKARAFTTMRSDFENLKNFWTTTYGADKAQEKIKDAKNMVQQDDRFWAGDQCRLDKATTKALFGTENLARQRPDPPVEVKKQVLNEMISLVSRPPADFKTGTITYVQEISHYDHESQDLTKFYSASSDAIKNHAYNAHLAKNANQASVSTAEGEKICGRSARSDTPERILDLIGTNALLSINSTNQPGMVKNEDGTYTYQFSITSGQDRSEYKHLGVIFGGEDEVASINNIENSIAALWPGDDYQLDMIIGRDDKGIEQVVHMNKPLFKTQILSGEATQKGVRKMFDTVNMNREANMGSVDKPGPSMRENQMLKEVLKKDITVPGGENGDAAKALNQKLVDCFDTIPDAIPEDFLSGGVLHQIESMPDGSMKTQLMKRYFALEAVCVNLSGKFMIAEVEHLKDGRFVRGERVLANGPYDQAKVVMCDMYLHEVLNIDEAYQCKSGCDRTLTLTATKTAMNAFEKEKGRPFNPFCMKAELSEVINKTDPLSKEHQAFAEYFRGAALTLGSNIVEMVRGEPKVKWGGHFVPRLFYNSKLADPIPGLKGLKTGEIGLSASEKAKAAAEEIPDDD